MSEGSLQMTTYQASKLNWENLHRNQVFRREQEMRIPEEFVVNPKNKRKELRQFVDLPGILPIKVVSEEKKVMEDGEQVGIELDIKAIGGGDFGKPLPPSALPSLNLLDPATQLQLLPTLTPISPELLVYTKPLAIIINPSSGKKRDLRTLISQRLDLAGIQHDYLLSTKAHMTWELARDLDAEKYSAIVAVGGDGTFHEVVNGMMYRADKRRLPVAFIPNGSGNDTLRALYVTSIDKALDFLVKGDLLKVDLTKVILDYNSESEIPTTANKENHLRYQLVNTSIGLPAKINHGAAKWKWCCCANPYEVSALGQFTKLAYDTIDVYIGEECVVKDDQSLFIMSFTGKHGGNGFLLNPLGLINDGQMEIGYIAGKHGVKDMIGFMDRASKKGGVHGYDSDFKVYRGKDCKIVMKNKKTGDPRKDLHIFAIDGEDMVFNDFVKYEVEYEGLEYIVDYQQLVDTQQHFK